MDIPQVGAARKSGTKNWNELKTKELPRRKSHLPKITIRNEDQTMDQSKGLEAKISEEETTTIVSMGLGDIPPKISRISLVDQTPHMGLTAQTMEDHLINAQVNHSIETMEIDPKMDLSTIRMETGGVMETFLVLHQIQEKTSHKIIPIVNQGVINVTTLRSADLTIDLRLVLPPMNKNFRRTIIKHHLMWFVSTQPMISSTNCRIFAR